MLEPFSTEKIINKHVFQFSIKKCCAEPSLWVRSSGFLEGWCRFIVDFGRQTWFQKDLKFGFSRCRPRVSAFLAEQVRSSGYLERDERVRNSVLVDKSGFESVQNLTCQIRSNSKLISFGFDPTLISITKFHATPNALVHLGELSLSLYIVK